jgi:peroxiredoxin Q/BCP
MVLAGCALFSGPSPGPGDKAPSFIATLDTGEKVESQKLMGAQGMVLYFYPKDETPGCTTQACTFQEQLANFQEKGYSIVGVSVDTGESHKAFKSKHNLTFSLVSDTDKAIAQLYNVPMATDPAGTVGLKRTTFVISEDGIVRRRFEDPEAKQQVEEARKALLPY